MRVRQADQTFSVTPDRVSVSTTIGKLAGPTRGKYEAAGRFVTIRFKFKNLGPKPMSASDAARYSLAIETGRGKRYSVGHLSADCRWLSVSAAKRAQRRVPTLPTRVGDTVATAVVYVVPTVDTPMQWRASLDERAAKLPDPK